MGTQSPLIYLFFISLLLALSTSKSTGVQTDYVQDGTINNDCGTTSKSLYGEHICSNLRATWGIEPANRRTRRELMSCVLASCSEEIFASFDDKEMLEIGSSEDCSDIELIGSNTLSHLQALVMKVLYHLSFLYLVHCWPTGTY